MTIVMTKVTVQPAKQQVRVIYPLNDKVNTPNAVLISLLRLNDEVLSPNDVSRLSDAIQKGWRGTATAGDFARSGPFGFALPTMCSLLLS